VAYQTAAFAIGPRLPKRMTELIAAAMKTAKRAGASALEAYSIDTSASKTSSNIFVGTASTFARADFVEVARRAPARPIMRHHLKAIPRRRD
jgi:hypothetical protein